jgi:hypothetical protein
LLCCKKININVTKKILLFKGEPMQRKESLEKQEAILEEMCRKIDALDAKITLIMEKLEIPPPEFVEHGGMTSGKGTL